MGVFEGKGFSFRNPFEASFPPKTTWFIGLPPIGQRSQRSQGLGSCGVAGYGDRSFVVDLKSNLSNTTRSARKRLREALSERPMRHDQRHSHHVDFGRNCVGFRRESLWGVEPERFLSYLFSLSFFFRDRGRSGGWWWSHVRKWGGLLERKREPPFSFPIFPSVNDTRCLFSPVRSRDTAEQARPF